MKLTKRMKSSLIQVALTNLFLFFVFVGAIAFFISPKLQAIDIQKTELVETSQQIQKVQKYGIELGDLKSSLKKINQTQSPVDSNIINNIDAVFYKQFFTNTQDISYIEFLNTIESDVSQVKNSSEYKEKISLFNTILPYYNPNIRLDKETLSDSYFINYVEKLLYTFNIQSEGDIGVGRIKKVSDNAEQNISLSEDIYVIPLEFKLTGRKKDITEFIHFLENVGNIEIQDDEVRIHSDEFINKVLSGFDGSDSYNIYAHQIADIESLRFPSYPDSSSIKSETDIVTRLTSEQSREKMEVEIAINFYVSGLPEYRIQGYISEFITDFEKLSQSIKSDTSKYNAELYTFSEGVKIQAVTTLESLSGLMTILEDEVNLIKGDIQRSENLEKLYDTVGVYRSQLDIIQGKYLQQIDLLTDKTK